MLTCFSLSYVCRESDLFGRGQPLLCMMNNVIALNRVLKATALIFVLIRIMIVALASATRACQRNGSIGGCLTDRPASVKDGIDSLPDPRRWLFVQFFDAAGRMGTQSADIHYSSRGWKQRRYPKTDNGIESFIRCRRLT